MSRFTATLLRASAPGFAGLAANHLLETSSDAGAEPPGDFEAWRQQLQVCVLELAAGLEDGDREGFAASLVWARDAFDLRGLDGSAMALALAGLRAVLEEKLPADAAAELTPFFERAERALEAPARSAGDGTSDDGEPVVRAFLDHVRAGDAAAAIESFLRPIRGGDLSPEEALERTLTASLRRIGALWHAGEIGVAEEHFASQVAGRVIAEILAQAARDRGAGEAHEHGRSVVLTMAEGDAHDLGIRIVAAFFELDGWRTVCFGSNTPVADLVQCVERLEPDLVVLGATLNTQREALRRTLEAVRSVRPRPSVLVGGPAFERADTAREEDGADGLATSPREALRLGRRLVGLPD